MKADARKLAAAIAKPSSAIRLYLLHGPDEASAQQYAKQLGAAIGADAERIDLDGATLRSDPARLADEAASLSLFATPRYIRLTGVGEESLAAITALLAAERAGNPVVAFAPTLRGTAKVVRLALDSPLALACALYEPTAMEAERLAGEIAREHGLILQGTAACQLAEASGGDRAVLRREIEKLALYLDAAPGRPTPLSPADIDAVGADLGDTTLTELAAAAIDGQPAALGLALDQAVAHGVAPVAWLRALQRRLLALAAMGSEVERGDQAEAVVERHRVFWREKDETIAALRRWSPAMLATALVRVRRAELAIMGASKAGEVIAHAEALAVARAAAAR